MCTTIRPYPHKIWRFTTGRRIMLNYGKRGKGKATDKPSNSMSPDSDQGLSFFRFQPEFSGGTHVNTLLQWIEREGAEGRRRLFEAIKVEYPKFTQAGLTHYIHGHRVPEFRVAEIVAKVTEIPIFMLWFRLTHKFKVSKWRRDFYKRNDFLEPIQVWAAAYPSNRHQGITGWYNNLFNKSWCNSAKRSFVLLKKAHSNSDLIPLEDCTPLWYTPGLCRTKRWKIT